MHAIFISFSETYMYRNWTDYSNHEWCAHIFVKIHKAYTHLLQSHSSFIIEYIIKLLKKTVSVKSADNGCRLLLERKL